MSRPIVGITCDYDLEKGTSQLHSGYYEGVLKAGGLPFLIPNMDKESISDVLDNIDGLLLTGGQDVEPAYFGESPHPKLGFVNPIRDELEIYLCKEAIKKDIPILGICRGVQIINIAMGGTIYQDLDSQWDRGMLLKHSQSAPRWYGTHEVGLVESSILKKLIGTEKFRVNSFHHQAIKEIAPCFRETAQSEDGVIEGIESITNTFAVGVQWHPERMWDTDKRMLGLFMGLVNAAKLYKK